MKNKHKNTLKAIFSKPIPSNITWRDIESLLIALGAVPSEGRGSRVRIELHGEDAVFHRPHTKKETEKGAIASMKKFLINAGVNYDDI